jgi:SP family general alpha glucoside:H+ symporter-like MFS transporter
MITAKANTETVENATSDPIDDMPVKSMGPIMRSREDDLGIWQCVRRFKTVSWIAMAAAFCASLDGYRKLDQAQLNNNLVRYSYNI